MREFRRGQLSSLSVADENHGVCRALRVIEASAFEILRFNASRTGGERNVQPSVGELPQTALTAKRPGAGLCPAAETADIS